VNEQVQQYERVTAAEVNDFVRERLGEENRASLLFVPRQHGAEDQVPSDEVAAGVGSGASS
jgi:hypothetical protein